MRRSVKTVKKNRSIVVVGSSIMDLTTLTDRFPDPGETVLGAHFELGFGGKGANQAVAARLCGAEVQMVSRVGDDLFGFSTIKNFKSLGIGVSHVRAVQGMTTGAAPIFVERSGQNRIVVVQGANAALTPKDIERAVPLFKRAGCVVLQLEIPMGTVYSAIRLARSKGVRVILNPAPALPLDLREITGVDYFIPNESEAEFLTKMPVRNPKEAEACARFLITQGFSKVILTMGSKGAIFAGKSGVKRISPFSVKTKDTTGAGDAFIGSFSAFLAQGLREEDALARASFYAALSTRKVGTQKSFASGKEFESLWRGRKK